MPKLRLPRKKHAESNKQNTKSMRNRYNNRSVPTLVVIGALVLTGSCYVYASCTKKATDAAQTRDYIAECQCSYVKYTTDAAGQSSASQATCKTCPTSIGGCETDSGTYPDVYEWSCSGSIIANSCETTPQCGSATHHTNAAKYKYSSAGCGTGA